MSVNIGTGGAAVKPSVVEVKWGVGGLLESLPHDRLNSHHGDESSNPNKPPTRAAVSRQERERRLAGRTRISRCWTLTPTFAAFARNTR